MNLNQLYTGINEENLKAFIEDTSQRVVKPLKHGGVFNLIFKKSWKEKELHSLQKANIQAALIYLEFLTNKKTSDFEQNVRNCLADLNYFYREFFPPSEDSPPIFNVNNIPTSIYFDLSKGLFYENAIPSILQKRSYLDLPVTYLLRMCLEGRIHGFLGIDYVRVGKNPISLSEILKLTQKLQTIEFSPSIKWDRIIKINDWLNHYIHRNLRPVPWCIHLAFQELELFFKNGMREFGSTKSYSSYASTYMEDKDLFQNEFSTILKQRFPGEETSIKWSGLHEIHLKP